jgi:hypothetical protein
MPKMRNTSLLLAAALLLISCNAPADQLQRAQHEFWENFARKDFFEVRLKKETLHWPLPPQSGDAASRLTKARELEETLAAIDSMQLKPEQQKQRKQLLAAVHDCVTRQGGTLFDPSRCDVLEDLQRLEKHPEWPVILQKVPEYYQEIEKRWQTPDAALVEPAVSRAQNTLDYLRTKSPDTAVEIATCAIKDFIGLCWSGWL